jgi:hypothetical protein
LQYERDLKNFQRENSPKGMMGKSGKLLVVKGDRTSLI